ncbi:MAG: 3-phosphoshikimate 1-carboxyvinyltransferase [Candidatus Thorarchaeota archaeon]
MKGIIQAPPSKSYTHRAIVCGLLSKSTTILNPLFCDDTEATLHLSKLMGAEVERNKKLVIKGPERLTAPISEMDCGGSGTTLRIFTALSSLADGKCVLTGDNTLRARPMTELLQALKQLGIKTSSTSGDGKPPIEVHGQGLNGGVVTIRGDISSQYITGLLLACAKSRRDTRIELTTELESKPYVEMTVEVMQHFGVIVEPEKFWDVFLVPGRQDYSANDFEVPGDYSSAAFLLASGVLCGRVDVSGLNPESRQGDSQIIQVLKKMGASIKFSKGCYRTNHSKLSAIELDVSNTPDLVPILAVLASQANGTTRISNAGRLRFKESDRLATTKAELIKMGVRIDETKEGLTINGPSQLHGAEIDSHQDHRIAMACVVAGLIAKGPTIVNGVECISKSYPEFIDHMQSLGAEIELNDRERRATS